VALRGIARKQRSNIVTCSLESRSDGLVLTDGVGLCHRYFNRHFRELVPHVQLLGELEAERSNLSFADAVVEIKKQVDEVLR